MLLLPPAKANMSLYVTGLTGPIGAAIALGRVMGFDGSGCAGHRTRGDAGRGVSGDPRLDGGDRRPGLRRPGRGAAAQLAASGIDCSEDSLEAAKGFVDIFAEGADPGAAVEGLGDARSSS